MNNNFEQMNEHNNNYSELGKVVKVVPVSINNERIIDSIGNGGDNTCKEVRFIDHNKDYIDRGKEVEKISSKKKSVGISRKEKKEGLEKLGEEVDTTKLSILYFNARSVKNKLEELK